MLYKLLETHANEAIMAGLFVIGLLAAVSVWAWLDSNADTCGEDHDR